MDSASSAIFTVPSQLPTNRTARQCRFDWPPDSDPCGRNILYTTAARIEDYKLCLAHAPRLSACREVGKLGMDLVLRHGPGAQRVVEIAAGSASLNVIHQDASTAHEGRSNLVLLRIVGADGGNEASPQVQIVGQD